MCPGLAEARRGAEAGLAPKECLGASAPRRLGPDQDLVLCACASLLRGGVSAAAQRSLCRCAAKSPPLRRLVPCARKRTDDGLVFRDGHLLQTFRQ